MGMWASKSLEAHMIASSPADPNWDQLAGFVASSKLSLLCVSRLMTVDVTQIRHYNRLIPQYSNYYYYCYSINLTFVLGIRMGDYSLYLHSVSLFITIDTFRHYQVCNSLVYSIHDPTEVAIQKIIDVNQRMITMNSKRRRRTRRNGSSSKEALANTISRWEQESPYQGLESTNFNNR
jgi:hypothetical protein